MKAIIEKEDKLIEYDRFVIVGFTEDGAEMNMTAGNAQLCYAANMLKAISDKEITDSLSQL